MRDVKDRFDQDVIEHQMSVLRDDDLYRHLRFNKSGTWTYGFDLVTWPGYLAIVGDAGDFVFSRIRDMFEFFEADNGRINPQYWSEKLQAPTPEAAQRYSEEKFRSRVRAWVESRSEELDRTEARALANAVEADVLRHDHHNEYEARQLLADFRHDDHYPLSDAWEWSLRDYDFRFLWCCHAIVWGISQWRKAQVPA